MTARLAPPGASALLIIDVQEGMFSIPGFELHEPEAFLARVSELIEGARASSTPIIYVQHLGAPGSAVESGTRGCEIHAAIAPRAGDLVVQKEESDSFLRTTLQDDLAGRGVTDLIVCGMQSEYCVDTACRQAYRLGYRVLLVADAHTTGGNAVLSGAQIVDHENETLGSGFVTLCRAAEVFA